MTPADQRVLDCHAAWGHECLSLEELYEEVWRACPGVEAGSFPVRGTASAFAQAAARMIEMRAISALNYRTDLG